MESSLRRPKLKAKIDEVKSPADGKPTNIKAPEKEQKSWWHRSAPRRSDAPGCASRLGFGPGMGGKVVLGDQKAAPGTTRRRARREMSSSDPAYGGRWKELHLGVLRRASTAHEAGLRLYELHRQGQAPGSEASGPRSRPSARRCRRPALSAASPQRRCAIAIGAPPHAAQWTAT